MPQLDREQVKLLALAVGVREAARQLKIPQATVQAWSARGKWFRQPDPVPVPPTMQPATIATKPSEIMSQMGKNTKLHLAKTAEKAAIRLSEYDADVIVDKAQNLRHIIAGSSTLHQWEAAPISVGTLNMGILANQAAVQVVSPKVD